MTTACIDSEIDAIEANIISGDNDKEIRNLSQKIIDSNEIVIFPTQSIYYMGVDLFNEKAIERMCKAKKMFNKKVMYLFGLGKFDLLPFLDLDNTETDLFNKLTQQFWPGPLIIRAKASKSVPSNVIDKNGYIHVGCPDHKITRNLIQYAELPLLVTPANHHGKIPSTCIQHCKDYFEHLPLTIINDNDYISPIGIESTIVNISSNKLHLIHNGGITLDAFKNFMNNGENIAKFKFETSITEPEIPYICFNNITSPCYLFDVIDFQNDIFEEKLNELKKATAQYLDECFLVDFKCTYYEYKDKFLGYVDLSRDGDINEARFNLYNVLHQISAIECKNILFLNFSHFETAKNNSIITNIQMLTSDKIVSIPQQFL